MKPASLRGMVPCALMVALLFSLSCAPRREGATGKGSRPGSKAVRIGVAFDHGGRGRGSFNALADDGLLAAARELGGRFVGDEGGPDLGDKVEFRRIVSRLDGFDYEQILQALADDGCGLVFALGSRFSEAIIKVARANPASHFVLVDASLPDLAEGGNLTAVSFAENEGSFLAGALAGLAVASDEKAKLGFIGGMDTPLVQRSRAGFVAGAAYANPSLRKPGMLLEKYLGKDAMAFNDPKAAAAAATAMYRNGCGIIYHCAGASSAGLFEAAKAAGKLAIGADFDQGLAFMTDNPAPASQETGRAIVSSMVKRVDRAVYLPSKGYAETGKAKGGNIVLDLGADGVGLARNEFNESSFAPYLAQLEELSAKVASGEIKVPADEAAATAFLKALK